jgi:DNA helicase-2/ATP-dependent DNA helicase PcrA
METDQFNTDDQRLESREETLAALTPAQREAVEHLEGPQLILAGPGSGKTRVVTHRVANMLWEGIPDHEILALTFTNKAADEMRQRLERLCPGRQVWMGTFHRFCAQQLRRYASLVGLKENYSIYDTDDALKLLREAINDADVELIHETPGRVATAIGWAKNDLITAEHYSAAPGSPLGSLVQRIYPNYQKRLLAANAVDFDDLLMHLAILLRENPELRARLDERFRYIMVDEYQDTNLAQYAIVRALSIDHPNLSVTGDPDQSIYGWRGATIRNILEFERDFPRVQVVRLEENFRSTQLILRAADQLIANNVKRKQKTLRTGNPEGRPVRIVVYPTARQESDAIAARIANEVAAQQRRCRDYAIFYRTNALSRSLERSFRAVSVPYQIVRGLEFYQRKEVKDILAYLQLLNNPASDVALLRIINTPPRKIGKTTIARISAHARQHGMPLFEAARQAGLIESLNKRAAVAVAKFVAMIDSMQLVGGETVEHVMGAVFHYSGYRDWLANPATEEERQRLDNLDELLSDAREFDESHPEEGGLEAFLEQASLVADVDDWETEIDCVTMMTLHAAKGLEFPVVYIVGMEDDLLPHKRSKEDPDQMEEERRLLFVGMTRAEEELQLSAAQERSLRGRMETRATSPFLMELPREEMEVIGNLGYSGFDYDNYVSVEDWEIPSGSDDDFGYRSELEFDEELQQQQLDKIGPLRSGNKQLEDAEPEPGGAHLPGPFSTAAEMAGEADDPPKFPVEAFRQGMVVIHPEYGLGKIVAIGGSGTKRTASVRFSNETRTFRLAHSPLRPVGR